MCACLCDNSLEAASERGDDVIAVAGGAQMRMGRVRPALAFDRITKSLDDSGGEGCGCVGAPDHRVSQIEPLRPDGGRDDGDLMGGGL